MNSHIPKQNNHRYIQNGTPRQEIKKSFPVFCVRFWHFQKRGVVGSRGRNAAALAKSPLATLKVLREVHTGKVATFLEQDSPCNTETHFREFLYPDNLDGESAPHTLGMAYFSTMQSWIL